MIMKKTKQSVKARLQKQWETACNGYLKELLRMWELDEYYGYWNSDAPGTIYHYGETHNLSMDDIIYCVEHDVEEDTVLEWEDYILDAHEFGFAVPNLPEWCRGCPRTDPMMFEWLRGMRTEINNAIEKEKERINKKNKEQ